MKTAILAITDRAVELGKAIEGRLPDSSLIPCRGNTVSAIQDAWHRYDALVCIMACGIVVRAISHLVAHKEDDPAVVVCDQEGRFAISLLSGHLGRANWLASKVAEITGGQAVITTASDVSGHTAVDLWAKGLGLATSNPEAFSEVMERLVDRGWLNIFSEIEMPPLPHDFRETGSKDVADIVITLKKAKPWRARLFFHPRVLVAGVGCNRGTAEEQIAQAVTDTCREAGLSEEAILRVATIDLKKDEEGLLSYCQKRRLELIFFSAQELDKVQGVSYSKVVKRATGTRGVCEPAAILGAGGGPLLVEKRKWKDVTVAIAKAASPWWEQGQGQKTL